MNLSPESCFEISAGAYNWRVPSTTMIGPGGPGGDDGASAGPESRRTPEDIHSRLVCRLGRWSRFEELYRRSLLASFTVEGTLRRRRKGRECRVCSHERPTEPEPLFTSST
ncbi:uncharacterized protein LOC112494947 [Cephus cinctus]|uniref:Uncharacterized protein LOC112494947 n=1 Tax=Cephus cinctus TaxID=211228 RepID=A0AAJ7W5I5_CEPCN|nr:uncharacterized protein LOC112494947 [Cephus cinctus]